MKKIKTKLYVVVMITLAFVSCSKPVKHIEVTSEVFHRSVDTVMEIMIHDIFSPPGASRVFVYPNIAAYEILAQKSKKFPSLVGKLNQLESIPKADTTAGVNLELAAIIAHMEIGKNLIFSEDRMKVLQDSLYAVWNDINSDEFETSKAYAFEVVNFIEKYMGADNYNQTRTMSKFTVDTDTGRQVVTVKDGTNGEIIRQIPSEEVLKLAQNLAKITDVFHVSGNLLETKV